MKSMPSLSFPYSSHTKFHVYRVLGEDTEMNCRVIVWMLAVGLTCLLTLLLTALLAVLAGIIAVAADRRRRQNKAPEQVPANTATQKAYGTHTNSLSL